jgi:hypothetical protein
MASRANFLLVDRSASRCQSATSLLASATRDAPSKLLAGLPAEIHRPSTGFGTSLAHLPRRMRPTAGARARPKAGKSCRALRDTPLAVRASMVTASRTRPRMHVASLRSIWLSLLHPSASRCLWPRVQSISLAYLEDPFYRTFLKRSGTFSRHLLIGPLFRSRTLTMLLTTIGGCPLLGFCKTDPACVAPPVFPDQVRPPVRSATAADGLADALP